MEFADRLKIARKEKKMSQAALAERTGLTLRTIQNYESGDRKPQNIDIVRRLSDALAIAPDALLGESGLQAEKADNDLSSAEAVRKLVDEVIGLFAGGDVAEEEKEGVMAAISEAYWRAKEKNRKYHRNADPEDDA